MGYTKTDSLPRSSDRRGQTPSGAALEVTGRFRLALAGRRPYRRQGSFARHADRKARWPRDLLPHSEMQTDGIGMLHHAVGLRREGAEL